MSDYYDGYMEDEFAANEEGVSHSTPQFYKSKGATRPSNLPPPAHDNQKTLTSSQKAHSPQNEGMSWVSISLIVVSSLAVCALGFAAYKHFTKGKK